ncbi:unnamed protein product [Darwinula stevensoni]|uniref:Uncharacterized protein n=1 Tax=Darwinula stevensoni TaxID=69355 RepID=A0A7R8ZY52_9CRUS|nr:unnamed protein product [Darwinula stevensoni]CAG0880840.1 unnamed protein product [Darwinula stevensoni]
MLKSLQSLMDPVTETTDLMRHWEEEHREEGYNPVPTLSRLAEIIEKETYVYLKTDQDPFDDRHPSRADPNCTLGHVLKAVFKKESFMNSLITDYLFWGHGASDGGNLEVRTVSARLVVDILPGLETSVVFHDNDALITELYNWAEKAEEPLRTYATGLLGAIMEVQDIAVNFRERNSSLVPVMLKRLKDLREEFISHHKEEEVSMNMKRPFAHLGGSCNSDITSPPKKRLKTVKESLSEVLQSSPTKLEKDLSSTQSKTWLPKSPKGLNDCSNSSWAEMEPHIFGTYSIHPLSLSTKQQMILKYLTPLGEYHEMYGCVVTHDAASLIMSYIDFSNPCTDARLAFEACRFLAALLCHKKFALDFIASGYLEKLPQVPRPSIAATGVSMCLYYLACCEDAMERVCLLPPSILWDLVCYGLWLLECCHESGIGHAILFFGACFRFKAILEYFDQQDGLRKLYNVISTLNILSLDGTEDMSEDVEFASRQAVRHVCGALKQYFEAHLAIFADELQGHSRSQEREPGCSMKPSKVVVENLREQIQLVIELNGPRRRMKPVIEIHKLGGVTLLLRIVGLSFDWNYSGRAETVRSALDVLAVCAIMPKTQEIFCEKVELPDEANAVGMGIILSAAEGEIVADAEVQKAALNVIITCVCAPMMSIIGNLGYYSAATSTIKKHPVMKQGTLLNRIWECVRANNGIMGLMGLMLVKAPITDADSIRALACHALAGLCRSESVKQVVGKLPLFSTGQLQILMREPILQEKRQEHVKFCKHALELLELLAGGKRKMSGNEHEISLQTIHKADVVAQTRIRYNEKQLLHLIHHHLLLKGYHEAAAMVQREASLPSVRMTHTIPKPPPPPHGLTRARQSSYGIQSSILSPRPVVHGPSSSIPLSSPIRLTLTNTRERSNSGHSFPGLHSVRSLQKNFGYESPISSKMSLHERQEGSTFVSGQEVVTLDSIVTEYLMNQHALCKNPMVTCPEFDLFIPHRCPGPKLARSAPLNLTARIARKSIFPVHGGCDGAALTRKLIYSRFRPLVTYRCEEEARRHFTCCHFTPCEQFIIAGNERGDLKLFNIATGTEEATYPCHDSGIIHVEPNKSGNLYLTSSQWRRPLSSVWSVGEFFELKFSLDDQEYAEFSKLTEDHIVGTKGETAQIFSVATGQKVTSFVPNPGMSNHYIKNKATFHPSDELILCDGVLWDVNSGKLVHKFDKFNQSINGVFHPNGREVISNTEVWDVRTFRLLRTVPALNQCELTFLHNGDVFFGISLERASENFDALETSFRSFDARDYTTLATIDVKKSIYCLAVDYRDLTIALVENTRELSDVSDSVVRTFEIGMTRDEDVGEDEDDEDGGVSDDQSEPSDDGSGSLEDEMIEWLQNEFPDLPSSQNNNEEIDEVDRVSLSGTSDTSDPSFGGSDLVESSSSSNSVVSEDSGSLSDALIEGDDLEAYELESTASSEY